MNDQTPNGNGFEARRRRLDELFADEPFLSPTMKARNLHEKLEGEPGLSGTAPGLPTEAFVRDRQAPQPRLDGGAPSGEAALPPPRPDHTVSLAEAAEYLRASLALRRLWATQGRISAGCAMRLQKFQEGKLCEWLKGAGRRI